MSASLPSLAAITSQFSGSVMVMTMICVGLAAGVGFLWQVANLRGTKLRGRRRSNEPDKAADKRKSDIRALSAPEKRLYAQAKHLLANGKVPAGARILEQLNMQREAIQSLEDANMIDEAAKILTRMQKHNRAGVVYARHGMWLEAAKSFSLANMPLEVAKCAREAGSWALAAEHFEAAGRLEDASEMREKSGDYLSAARLLVNAGDSTSAMALYDQLPRAGLDLTRLNFQPDELNAIIAFVAAGNAGKGLVEIVFQHGRIHDAVSGLINNRLASVAVDLYRRSTSDLGPQLIAEVDYQNGAALVLAQVFVEAGHLSYAGKVYEHAGTFGRAGECFEKVGDIERAIYCYERGGQDRKASALRAKPKVSVPASGPSASRQAGSNFALSNLPDSVSSDVFGDGERTTVLATQDDEPSPPRTEETAYNAPQIPNFSDDENHQSLRAPVRATFSMAAEDSDDNDAAESTPIQDGDPPPQSEEAPATLSARPPVPAVPVMDMGAAAPDPAPAPFAVLAPQAAFAEPAPQKDHGETSGLPPDRAAFHRAKFLSDLDFAQKNALWDIGRTKKYAEHGAILTYNDEPEGVYIILSGSVSCFRSVNGKETYVDQMGEAESFGELWLLADQPSAVRFVAAKETEIRVIGREAFNQLMDLDGTLARKVYKRFTLRLLKRLLKPQNTGKIQAAS